MTHSRDVVGIDVAKNDLEVYALAVGQERHITNTAAGHAELTKWLKSLGVTAAIMEASGGYERGVACALQHAGFAVRIVAPKRVRHFAKAIGRLAKNDRIDARVIAEFGAVCASGKRCAIAADAKRDELAGLLTARQALIEHQTALRNQICASPQVRFARSSTRHCRRWPALIIDSAAIFRRACACGAAPADDESSESKVAFASHRQRSRARHPGEGRHVANQSRRWSEANMSRPTRPAASVVLPGRVDSDQCTQSIYSAC